MLRMLALGSLVGAVLLAFAAPAAADYGPTSGGPDVVEIGTGIVALAAASGLYLLRRRSFHDRDLGDERAPARHDQRPKQ